MSGVTVEHLQQRVEDWAAEHLDTTSDLLAALKVAEEAGELAGAVVKARDGSGRPHGDPEAELADVIIACLTFATFANIDAAAAIESKLWQLEQRQLFDTDEA